MHKQHFILVAPSWEEIEKETMDKFKQLKDQKYLNLETFRKNGAGVKTPVWFVQEGEILFIRTIANSGKVKRIRNMADVNIAACKVDGALISDWLPATAREMNDKNTDINIDRLLDKKYGLMKKLFAAASMLQGRKYTILEVKARE
jgi:uncharacterized protein